MLKLYTRIEDGKLRIDSGLFFRAVLFLSSILYPLSSAYALGVKPSSTIDRDKVYVGDLFDIEGDVALQPVGDAPAAGQTHIFDIYALRRVANAYGLDWQPADGSIKISIKRDSTPITNEQITDAVRNALGEKLQSLKADSVDVTLDRRNLEINLPANIGVPDIHVVDVTYNPADYRFKGTLIAETEKTQAEPFMLPVTGRAIPNVNVPILSHRLGEGAIIGEADIETLVLPVNKVTPDLIIHNSKLVGKEVRRELAEGSMVRSRDIRPQQLVKRGRMVTMVIERGPLRVTAQGRAMGDGGAGDIVRVLNNISNRVIEGTILNDGTVAIAAGA